MKKTLYRFLLPCLLAAGWLLIPAAPLAACDITVSDTTIQPACAGLALGSIALVHDGTAPFTYVWSHNSTLNTATATNLPGGNYSVSITDSAGCTTTVVVTVPAPVGPQAFLASISDTCELGRGKAIATIVGGVGTVSLLWSDSLAQTNDTAFNLLAGNYTLIARDSQGCADTAIVTVLSRNDVLSLQLIPHNATCHQKPDGSIKAIPQNVTGAWTFSWSSDTNAVTDSISGLLAGTYTCTVSLGACSAPRTTSIGQPQPLVLGLFVVQSPGCNTPDGTLRAVASGGTQPYRFLWETAPTQQANDTAFNVLAGPVFYSVTDTNGCTLRQEYILETNLGPNPLFEQLREDFCGKAEGVVRVRTTGGREPFTYEWRSFESLLAGETTEFLYNRSYQESVRVIITDADSCVRTLTTTITGTPKVRIGTFNTEDEYCQLINGLATAIADPATGRAPYTYFWNSTPVYQGVDSTTADSLIHGTYRVIVADSNNCRDSIEFEIGSIAGFELEATPTDASCANAADGILEISALNAPYPLSYAWADDPARNVAIRSDLNPGDYLVTVTDSRNCTRAIAGTVGGPPPLLPDFTSKPLSEDSTAVNIPIQFLETSEGEDFYLWDFGNGIISAEPNPTLSFPLPGTYDVQLIVINNNGRCMDTVIKPYVIIPASFVKMPDAFTPNFDLARINEVFGPVYAEIDTITLRVFDRYGKEIFNSTGGEAVWDGKIKGTPAPEGEYMYRVYALGLDKVVYQLHGKFLLIR